MDKKIEEMVLAVYPWLKEVPIEERKQLRENVSGLMVMERLYNAGYRKESDTATEILTELVVFVNDWFEGVENNDFCVEFNRISQALFEKYNGGR